MATKEEPIATVTSVETSPVEIESAHLKTERRVRQAIWTIVGGVALPCIPIIVITTVLLYFIFHHQVHLSPGWEALRPITDDQQNFTSWLSQVRHGGGSAAYYVEFNPSTITTVSNLLLHQSPAVLRT